MTAIEGTSARAWDGADYLTPDPSRVRGIGTEADWPEGLSEWGREYHRSRGIGPLVAAARGTYSITTSRELPLLPTGVAFGQAVKRAINQADNEALIFPLHHAEGGTSISQARLRVPRPPKIAEQRARGKKKAKPPKFETPTGASRSNGTLYPDRHPLSLDAPASAPIILTEGPGKADAIMTAAMLEGLAVVPIMLTGVTLGYLAPGGKENPTNRPVLAPLIGKLTKPGQLVILAFDADRTSNPLVGNALRTTGELMEAAGAVVMVADVPSVNDDTKSGIDDYLTAARAAGAQHPLSAMLLGAQPLAVALPERSLTLVSAAARTVTEALATPTTVGHGFPIAEDHGVYIGGPRHGLWHLTTRYDAEADQEVEVPVQVTDWVAWRSRKTATLTVDDHGRATPAAEPRYDVQLVRRDGRRFEVPDLTGPESLDVINVVTRADAAVTLPTGGLYQRDMIRNMLACLGQTTEGGRDDREKLAAMGWMRDPQHGWVYCAPAGSIGVNGVVTDVVVGAPIGSEDSALKPAQERTGWTRVAEGDRLHEAAPALKSLVNIAPKRPEVGVAMLGVQAAAPLMLKRRATLILVGKPGTGKSLCASAGQAFQSSVEVTGGDFSFSFSEGSTRTGAELVLQWSRHATGFFDDYRIVGDRESNRRTREALVAVAQGVYNGAGKTQGTRGGGLRAQTSIRACAIVTAEEEPTDEAIIGRTVIIELAVGDVPLEGHDAPIDTFRKMFAETGLAQEAWASYLRFLARHLTETSPAEFVKLSESMHRRYRTKYAHARAGETVALIATGWWWLRYWAEEEGVDHLLPSKQEIKDALEKMVHTNRVQHDAGRLEKRITSALRAGIEGRRFHVLGPDRFTPPNPGLYGWTPESSGSGSYIQPTPLDYRWVGRGLAVGFLSNDATAVLVTPAGVKAALDSIGMGELQTSQIHRAFDAAGYAGGVSTRASMKLLSMGQNTPRGWLIPAEHLGLDVLHETEATTVVSPQNSTVTDPEGVVDDDPF